MKKSLFLLAAALLLAIVVSACSTTPPEEPTAPPEPDGETFGSLDDQLVKMGERLPGFGGMFFDDNGDLNVYLQDAGEGLSAQALETQRVAVADALTDVFGENLLSEGAGQVHSEGTQTASQKPAEVKLLKGQYDIATLANWRGDVDRTLGSSSVILTDLDEAKNRMRIGVEAGSSRAQLEQQLSAQGIPLEAVIIEEIEPFSLASHTLRSKVRPNQGGYQIAGRYGSSGWACTLGFNAYRSSLRGFITNSHCTGRQGGVEYTPIYQPTAYSSNYIGYEVLDPSYFTGGACPSGRRCRYSDSAFIRYTSSASSSLGRVARTTSWGGSTTINHSAPTMRITGEVSYPKVGEYLDKVGRTTGWRFGKVSATCVNINVNGTNITQLCQDTVKRIGGSAIVGSGDSGSPVFKWLGSTVKLYGVLWGQNGSGTEFTFSAMQNIEYELGALKTY